MMMKKKKEEEKKKTSSAAATLEREMEGGRELRRSPASWEADQDNSMERWLSGWRPSSLRSVSSISSTRAVLMTSPPRWLGLSPSASRSGAMQSDLGSGGRRDAPAVVDSYRVGHRQRRAANVTCGSCTSSAGPRIYRTSSLSS